MNKFDLNNRVSVVTGGAQGFGLAIAKKFLECGAEVIAWDIDKEALNKAQEKIINYGLSNTFGFGGHNASVLFKKYTS